MSEQDHKDKRLLERIRTTLDEAHTQLDQDTLRRLQRARHVALDQLHKPHRRWQPIVGLTVAASISLLVIGLVTLQTGTEDLMHQNEDLSLLTTGDDLELYENLEFYQWLELTERRS